MRYKVRLHETNTYDMEVDAKDSNAAIDAAWGKLSSMNQNQKDSYFHDSDGCAEVFEQGE